MPTANIVVVLDRSGSMGPSQYNYLGPAQTDASTFINLMHPGDSLAAVAFQTSVAMVYPNSQSLVLIPQDQSVQNAASQAIVALTATGSTNMAGAVQMANAILASAAVPRGIVFLSDGEYNVGPNPNTVVNTAIPIYTIALGPSAGTSTLQQMATNTQGVYNYAPDAWSLADIYYAIVGQSGVAQVTTNQQKAVPNYQFQTVPATIAAGNAHGYFSVAWTDQSIQFTPSTPVGKQVNIGLRSPGGQTYATPTATGPGFVVFKIPNPQAGTWQVGSWVASPTNFQSSVGAFEPDSPTTLQLAAPAEPVAAGSPVELNVNLADNGEPLSDAAVTAALESPAVTVDQALRLHADRLMSITPDAALLEDGVPEEHARLFTLMRTRPDLDLLPRSTIPLPAEPGASASHLVRHPGLLTPGSHTLHVSIRGYSPTTKSEFTRVQRVSFVVE